MKKLNPQTNLPYVRGETREDGYVFWSYRTSNINMNGFYRMNFVQPNVFKRRVLKQKQDIAKRQLSVREKVLKKRMSKELKPDGSKWQFGDFNNGMYFRSYSSNQSKRGFQSGVWLTPNAWHKSNIRNTSQRTKDRAKKNNLKWELTTEYLMDIYPQNNICPVLNIKLDWAGDRTNSPSLDRLSPEKGYVRGNVFWISWKANLIKSIGSAEEHLLIAKWMKERNKS